jgi:bis(5'-nucleosidyl)-tetraphosphatase
MFQFSTFYSYKDISDYRIDVYTGSFEEINLSKAKQSYGIILNKENQIVLAYNSNSGFWILPGGTVEAGETTIETLVREVYEETAVIVDETTIKPAFYQNIYEIQKKDEVAEEKFEALQVRYIARAGRIDKFVSDPGGSMTEVKWVNIEEIDEYLKWGETNKLIIKVIKDFLSLEETDKLMLRQLAK